MQRYYNSLPPISKVYGTLCLLFTVAIQLGVFDLFHIALIYKLALTRFQVWRLITNFFFLGKFSINFGIRLLMIARYGVQLEKGPFDRRTADFLWMMIFGALSMLVLAAIPLFYTPFLGISLVFMLVYVWSREFPNAQINIYGLVTLKAFYLPWAMLALDVIFGSHIMPDLLGIIAGHLYYFLTVLHPLATGKTLLKTPRWVHKLVARYRIGAPAPTNNRAAQPERPTGAAFSGRSHRLSD
ncbi:derlin-1 isoform X2 [Jatropha curcas]|uniref:derlin-1 isoform X2 n=1 Tax=Jatropha curcas TaxID=180498 RepID=UPI0005FBEEAB|nr:derlin-1 isoform X2 [Jatropha curcas]